MITFAKQRPNIGTAAKFRRKLRHSTLNLAYSLFSVGTHVYKTLAFYENHLL